MISAKPATQSTTRSVSSAHSSLNLYAFLTQEFEQLYTYFGDSDFVAMLRAYGVAYADHQHGERWFSSNLPAFLKSNTKWRKHPELAELASLELAFNLAASAPDLAPLHWQTIKHMDPEQFSELKFVLHPSVQHLHFLQNTTSIWSALKCDERPPAPHRLDAVQNVLVWRQGTLARFRMIGEEEAQALSVLVQEPKPTQQFGSPFESPQTYLREWVEAELIILAEKA